MRWNGLDIVESHRQAAKPVDNYEINRGQTDQLPISAVIGCAVFAGYDNESNRNLQHQLTVYDEW